MRTDNEAVGGEGSRKEEGRRRKRSRGGGE